MDPWMSYQVITGPNLSIWVWCLSPTHLEPFVSLQELLFPAACAPPTQLFYFIYLFIELR